MNFLKMNVVGHKNSDKIPVPRVVSMAEEAIHSDSKATSVAHCQRRSYY